MTSLLSIPPNRAAFDAKGGLPHEVALSAFDSLLGVFGAALFAHCSLHCFAQWLVVKGVATV